MATSEPPRREGRRRGIPPAPPVRQQFEVLGEVSEPLGTALWQSLRNVLLWARTPAEARAGLFRPVGETVRARYAEAAGSAPELGSALHAFAALQEAAAEARPESVAAACGHVWDWASRRGMLETAIHFAEAAAYVETGNATWPVVAGYVTRLAGGSGMLHRSAAWHQRGLALAVRSRNDDEAIRALTGMGALFKEQGRVDEAWAVYERAARRAVRTGRKRRAAVVRHYMFALAVEKGRPERAVREAAAALDLYPLHDERLPSLAYDFAYLLLTLGHHGTALRLLDRAAGGVYEPSVIGLVFGATARAAAGAGRPARHRTAERAALGIVALYDQHAAATLVHLAEAARLLGAWGDAESYAARALEAALRKSDREVERLARELVDVAARREAAPPAEEPPPEHPTSKLARRLAARLRRWKRPRRRAASRP